MEPKITYGDNGKGMFVKKIVLDFEVCKDFPGLEKKVKKIIKERMNFTNPNGKIREYLQKHEGITFPNKFPDYNIEENVDKENQQIHPITSVSTRINDGSYYTSQDKEIYLTKGESRFYPLFSNPKLNVTIETPNMRMPPEKSFDIIGFMNYLKTGEISS